MTQPITIGYWDKVPSGYTGIALRRTNDPKGFDTLHCKDGMLHREDGPAIICFDGSRFWYINNKTHRLDGPAAEYADGTRTWYLFGWAFTEEEHNLTIKEMETVRAGNPNLTMRESFDKVRNLPERKALDIWSRP